MAFWTSLTGLFASKKVVESGLDLIKKGTDGIDMLFYTDEEKEIQRKEWFQMVLKSEETNQEQATERSRTRRDLANAFCKVYLALIIIGVGVVKFEPALAGYIAEQVKGLSYAVVPIIVFFFGSYGYGTYMKKKA